MQGLDDIKFAVRENHNDEIIAFFEHEEDCNTFVNAANNGLDKYTVLNREDGDFYIDVHIESTSSFDVRY